jgi:hypothetical protein
MADTRITQLPPFLNLPAEVRLQIYSYLIDDNDEKTFQIRSEDPKVYASRAVQQPHQRTGYRILAGVLYGQSKPTTYRLASTASLHTNVLAVNRQVSEEVVKILYGEHRFDFGDNIEAIVPFLSDLRPSTRALIQEVALTKKGSVFTRDFDSCEWHNACASIGQTLQLRKIELRVVGGKPLNGWDNIVQYTVQDFRTLASVRFEGLEWVREFIQIQSLNDLEVIPTIEHCPPPRSTAMTFFAAFSASIDKGFTAYLREQMLSRC